MQAVDSKTTVEVVYMVKGEIAPSTSRIKVPEVSTAAAWLELTTQLSRQGLTLLRVVSVVQV